MLSILRTLDRDLSSGIPVQSSSALHQEAHCKSAHKKLSTNKRVSTCYEQGKKKQI